MRRRRTSKFRQYLKYSFMIWYNKQLCKKNNRLHLVCFFQQNFHTKAIYSKSILTNVAPITPRGLCVIRIKRNLTNQFEKQSKFAWDSRDLCESFTTWLAWKIRVSSYKLLLFLNWFMRFLFTRMTHRPLDSSECHSAIKKNRFQAKNDRQQRFRQN